MVLNQDGMTQDNSFLTLNGESVEVVDDFKYLGSMMSCSENDFKKQNRPSMGSILEIGKDLEIQDNINKNEDQYISGIVYLHSSLWK